MISAIELKKYVAGTGIHGIVVCKLCYEKKLYLIILLKLNKDLEVSFYHVTLPFCLTVRLWVEGDKKSPLNVEKIAQIEQEF